MPSHDDVLDALLGARSGDLDDVRRFVAAFSPAALDAVHDDNGNTLLHMAAANGHTGEHLRTFQQGASHIDPGKTRPTDILAYILPLASPSLLTRQNNAGSTALHWAALNRHLDVVQALVQSPSGPGASMIDIKNAAGRSVLGEAELAGWDEGARWLVQVMRLDGIKEQVVEEDDQPSDPSQAIEVEIQDADGQVARMTIDPNVSVPDQAPS